MQILGTYKTGNELINDLEKLPVGGYIVYHGVVHKIIDAGSQGHRIAAIKDPEAEIKQRGEEVLELAKDYIGQTALGTAIKQLFLDGLDQAYKEKYGEDIHNKTA